MTTLLDANVLIALAVTDHVHHHVVEEWFRTLDERFASCPTTQGALVRLILRGGGTADQALQVLGSLTGHPSHDFWPDDRGYQQIAIVIGVEQAAGVDLTAVARDLGYGPCPATEGLGHLTSA